MLRSALASLLLLGLAARAEAQPPQTCPRPAPGEAVAEPTDLRSSAGVLDVDLFARNAPGLKNVERYCYQLADGTQSPTLRLKPGDLLILRLHNELATARAASARVHHPGADGAADPCNSGVMSATSTNLHFHGLSVPPRCHEDEVLKTSLQPGEPPFEYRVRIPADEPPGLYWYHPHIHGFSSPKYWAGLPVH